jgi:ribosome-associated protein
VAKRAERAARQAASLAKARRVAEVAEAKRAEDVVILDLRGLTLVTDYFVICTGTSRVQIRAISEAVVEALDDERPRGIREGDADAQWVLLDYGDVVAHVFGPEARAFYRLEKLWADAPIVAP